MKQPNNVLNTILEDVKHRIKSNHLDLEFEAVSEKHLTGHRKSLYQAIRSEKGVSIIAEIKPKSPSKGALRKVKDGGSLAHRLVEGGAVGISVLTEPSHFGGSLSLLKAVKDVVQTPVLAKDFFLYRKQVFAALKAGADAILLIATIHKPASLAELIQLSADYGIEALVEVHDEKDLEKILEAGVLPRIIGINNRDLRTLRTDLSVTEKLASFVRELFGSEVLIVSESGISSGKDVIRLKKHEVDAVLVGSAIMEASSPKEKVQELREAGKR